MLVVEPERLPDSGLGQRAGLGGTGNVVNRIDGVGFGQPGVGQGIGGILLQGLLELLGGLLEHTHGALVPVKTALQVELIGFGVIGVVAGGAARGLAGGPEAELHGDGAGNLVLDGLHLGNAARELLAPKLRILGDVHQLDLNVQDFAAQGNAASEDGVDAEVASSLHGVNSGVFIAEGAGAWHDAELRLLRQGIGEGFRNAVAEVVEAGVAGHVDERKNGERVDGAGDGATRDAAAGRSGRERLQHKEQIADGLETLGRVFLQAMSDEALEVRIRKRRRFLSQRGGQGVAGAGTSEGAAAAEHLIEHAA